MFQVRTSPFNLPACADCRGSAATRPWPGPWARPHSDKSSSDPAAGTDRSNCSSLTTPTSIICVQLESCSSYPWRFLSFPTAFPLQSASLSYLHTLLLFFWTLFPYLPPNTISFPASLQKITDKKTQHNPFPSKSGHKTTIQHYHYWCYIAHPVCLYQPQTSVHIHSLTRQRFWFQSGPLLSVFRELSQVPLTLSSCSTAAGEEQIHYPAGSTSTCRVCAAPATARLLCAATRSQGTQSKEHDTGTESIELEEISFLCSGSLTSQWLLIPSVGTRTDWHYSPRNHISGTWENMETWAKSSMNSQQCHDDLHSQCMQYEAPLPGVV